MYSPLVSQFEYKPSSMFSTTLQVNYDLNEGEIINLNHILSGTTSTNGKTVGSFRAYFTYAPSNNQNYQLQTLSLTKDLHERKLTLFYTIAYWKNIGFSLLLMRFLRINLDSQKTSLKIFV